jgi:phage FluMu protein Com
MPAPMDGNMLGGPLSEFYGTDVTGSSTRCTACGTVAVLAAARVFVGAGLVVRCRTCDTVLATVLERADRVEVHLHALRGLPETV